jgi:competence protein ComEC
MVRIQAALAVGLVGLGAAWFGRVSVVAPLANLAAVPWFSLFVVPPALLGLALHGPAPVLADLSFLIAGRAVELALPVLERVAAWPGASFRPVEPRAWAVLAALLGAAWWLLPRPCPGRFAGAALLLPLLWARGPGLADGEYEVHVLDVGQGLAVLVRTRGHAVLYDTGPAWPGGDAGERAVLPALGALGVTRLDVLVLSHGDSDHAGGAVSVLAAMAADRRIGGAGVTSPGFESCHRDQRWTADGVAFETLHPGAAAPAGENDGSCVLLVAGPGGRTLLTGDLERAGERELLRVAPSLRAELVIAPHHGSRSSSTPALVSASQPGWVAFAAGHANRWGFPADEVVRRWRAAGALPLSTDRHGAIVVRFERESAHTATTLRQADCRPWRDCR